MTFPWKTLEGGFAGLISAPSGLGKRPCDAPEKAADYSNFTLMNRL
jgi:hypothetical protein